MDLVIYALAAVAGVVVVTLALRVIWHLESVRRIRRAGPRRLKARTHRIWREPTDADLADLTFGPGGPELIPAPPFRFAQEHFSGSRPSVAVRDRHDRLWRVKWGNEARPETFAVRFAWALGYFAEVTHYIAEGRIEGALELQRAHHMVGVDGLFHDARFELEDESIHAFFDEHSWAWNDNPFVGTPQLHGLKMVTMLLSNWDTKDRRDVARGSNTAIFEHRIDGHREARYLITDWGGSMGSWGSNIVSRGRWDAAAFEAQTPGFVSGVVDGFVCFSYQGQRTAEIARDITVADAAWFYEYAGRLTEHALEGGLKASGATEEEATRFARALRDRILQIGHCAREEAQRTIRAG